MLAIKLIQSHFPSANYFDTVSFALQLIEDNELMHIPVIGEDKFKGILSKETLLNSDENALIDSLEKHLIPAFINGDAYFLSAIKVLTQFNVTIVGVINEQFEMVGVIPIGLLQVMVITILILVIPSSIPLLLVLVMTG